MPHPPRDVVLAAVARAEHPPYSPRGSVGLLPSGTQPRCVQIPIATSHFSCPAFTRALSFSGSISAESGVSSAVLISSAVRLRTNTGLPRQTMVIAWPSTIGARSTSTELSASTSRAGFMLSMNGHTSAPAPITAALPVSSFRKSRLVGSSAPTVLIASRTFTLAVSAISILYSAHPRPIPPPHRGPRSLRTIPARQARCNSPCARTMPVQPDWTAPRCRKTPPSHTRPSNTPRAPGSSTCATSSAPRSRPSRPSSATAPPAASNKSPGPAPPRTAPRAAAAPSASCAAACSRRSASTSRTVFGEFSPEFRSPDPGSGRGSALLRFSGISAWSAHMRSAQACPAVHMNTRHASSPRAPGSAAAPT